MVTKIYIVRHAEAEGNIYRRSHGWYDAYLTPNGLKQVENLENRMKGIHLDAIYSSDLRRTWTTAGAPSRASGVEILPEKGLRELQMGEWENLSWGDCNRLDRELASTFACDAEWRSPGAESVGDLIARTGEALRRLVARHEGQSICLVSHSVAIRALFVNMGIKDVREAKMVPNASLTLFEYENGVYTPIFIGDNAHNADVPLHQAHPFGGGTERPTLWFRSASADEAGLAADLWGEAWLAVHGSMRAFDHVYAERRIDSLIELDPNAVRFAYCGDELAGVLLLDAFTEEADVLHVSLLMLREKFRGHGLAVQLIGEVVTRARLSHRSTLRLRVAKRNARAIALYEQNGFETVANEFSDMVMKRAVLPAKVLD